MRVALCLDGSGAFTDGTYRKEMKHSFVHQISQSKSMGCKPYYWLGPDMTGVLRVDRNAGVIGAEAFLKYFSALYDNIKGEPIEIYICGYSRGAMAAIYTANRIAQFNQIHKFSRKSSNFFKRQIGFKEDQIVDVKIKSLVLFDAVDSDLTMLGMLNSIPSLVQRCHHFVCKAPKSGNRSRDEFNRLILERDGDGGEKIAVTYHECTHSAIGGMPGEGDNTKPIPTKTQAAGAGVAGAARVAMVNPILAVPVLAGGAVAGLAKRAIDKEFYSSGISVDQDWKEYPGLCTQVNKVLQAHGWGTAITPQSRWKGSGGSW